MPGLIADEASYTRAQSVCVFRRRGFFGLCFCLLQLTLTHWKCKFFPTKIREVQRMYHQTGRSRRRNKTRSGEASRHLLASSRGWGFGWFWRLQPVCSCSLEADSSTQDPIHKSIGLNVFYRFTHCFSTYANQVKRLPREKLIQRFGKQMVKLHQSIFSMSPQACFLFDTIRVKSYPTRTNSWWWIKIFMNGLFHGRRLVWLNSLYRSELKVKLSAQLATGSIACDADKDSKIRILRGSV